jgi:histidine triad (HIT) family protein
MAADCVFCKIASGEIPTQKICENDNFFSVADKNPKVKGHCLVISKKHFETSLDLPSTLGHELLDCIKRTSLKVIEETKAEGFNIISNNFESAGQVVKHLHFHILPRKKGDGFSTPAGI